MGILDTLSQNYARFQPYTRTATFRLFFTVTVSSVFTAVGLLSFQSFQRSVHRKALRDSIEAHYPGDGKQRSKKDRRKSSDSDDIAIGGRPSSIRSGNLDDEDDEIQDYSDPQRAQLEREKAAKLGMNRKRQGQVDEEIINEQLARNIAFIGEEAQQKIRESFVIVVGVGGVGSAAATMLVRSGVGKVRLIDFDQVSLSSLNRHAVATLADVGTPKVLACKKHFQEIAPWVEIDARIELFGIDEAERLLSGNPTWVVDCIDNIQTKVDLLKYCHERKIQVFSAMGAGGKCDPSRIQISDISTTFEDPLARSVRQKLKKEGVNFGIPVVYSTEKPNTLGKLLPLPEEEFQKGAVHELSALEAFRVRILPVLGPLPSMFGQAAAAYIIAQLAGNVNMEPLAVKNRYKQYIRLHTDLAAREQRLTGSNKIPLTNDDVVYIYEELHRGRSIVAPTYAACSRPVVVRWRKEGPVNWGNLVVMEREEGAKHEKEVLVEGKQPEEVWDTETCDLVKRRFELEKESRDYRLL